MYVSKNKEPDAQRTHRKWTAQDDAAFIRLYAVLTIVKVAEYFEITEQAVKNRAKYLGCRKKLRPGAWFHVSLAAPLEPLEFAPGNKAVDQKSYDLLKKAGAIR